MGLMISFSFFFLILYREKVEEGGREREMVEERL